MTNRKLLSLKQCRSLLDETQDVFAELVGVSRSQYSKMENGEQNINLNEMLILKEHINKGLNLKLTLEDIFLSENVLIRTIESA